MSRCLLAAILVAVLSLPATLSAETVRPPRPLLLSLRASASSPIATANPAMFGGELSLRVKVAPKRSPDLGLVLGGGYEQGMRWTWTGRLRTGSGRAMVGLAGEKRLRKIDLTVGGGVQALLLHQILQYTEPGERQRFDFEQQELSFISVGPWAQVGLHLPVGPTVGLELGVRGTFYPVTVDGSRSFFAMVQGYGGVGFRFGGKRVGQVGRKKRAGR